MVCTSLCSTWSGLEISFTEYAKEISLINLPSHQRRDRKSQITPRELSQLRSLSGQLLWLGMQCFPQLLALLSLLMRQTPQATVDTTHEVNKLAWKATLKSILIFSCCGYVHRCWMDHSTRRHFARVTAGLYRKRRVVAKQRIEHFSESLALESSEICGKFVICSRNSSSSRRR